MPTVNIDGITTRYEISGAGPPILMMAPGGFDSTLEKWSTTWPWQHFLPLQTFAREYTCIAYDRREAGQSGGRVEQLTWATCTHSPRPYGLPCDFVRPVSGGVYLWRGLLGCPSRIPTTRPHSGSHS
jgi:pimeloyl-ACP methyl ester carboxylesterase